MGYKVITPVAGDVIPLADLRQHLRLDMFAGDTTHPDDALIQGYLSAAREYAEHYTQRSIGQQTIELALDSFPSAGIELPLGAASITSVKFIDDAMAEQPINPLLYSLDNYSFDHWAIPVSTWPAAAPVANAIKVVYITPATFPAAARAAMLLYVGHLYQNREAVNADRGASAIVVPFGVNALLDTFRKWSM